MAKKKRKAGNKTKAIGKGKRASAFIASLARRRLVLGALAFAGLGAWFVKAQDWLLPFARQRDDKKPGAVGNQQRKSSVSMNNVGGSVIERKFPLDFQWPVVEPFIFCVHHYDRYPAGTAEFAPPAELMRGRNIGQDFVEKDGFRMYHGQTVPGFPVHPHRGFETVTIVRKGYVDHADSLGAAGRYGEGDVQWMTAGSGVQHSEMFPLLHSDKDNTLELFQIWLNLPARNKMVPPHFAMLWSEQIPHLSLAEGKVRLSLIAGDYQGTRAPAPPPDSWASDAQSDVQIWLVKMDAEAAFELPQVREGVARTLYLFDGDGFQVNGEILPAKTGASLAQQASVDLRTSKTQVEFLLLQARPIGEPVFQHGPFVMNTQAEIMQAIRDYQNTQFGGWDWPRPDMVHGDKIERFARFPDGRIERPQKA